MFLCRVSAAVEQELAWSSILVSAAGSIRKPQTLLLFPVRLRWTTLAVSSRCALSNMSVYPGQGYPFSVHFPQAGLGLGGIMVSSSKEGYMHIALRTFSRHTCWSSAMRSTLGKMLHYTHEMRLAPLTFRWRFLHLWQPLLGPLYTILMFVSWRLSFPMPAKNPWI